MTVTLVRMNESWWHVAQFVTAVTCNDVVYLYLVGGRFRSIKGTKICYYVCKFSSIYPMHCVQREILCLVRKYCSKSKG
jgi:hypothetical protein